MILTPSGLTAQSHEITGNTRVITSSKNVTGNITGSLVQAARVGTEFHVLVKGLPKDKTVQMELGFAELEQSAPNLRSFDVYINNKPAITNLDVFSEAGGPNKSIIKKFSITPENGSLDFHFKSSIGEALINYIRVSSDKKEIIVSPGSALADSFGTLGSDSQFTPDEQATFDVETASIELDSTSKTWGGGVPIGGIGTGKFEILPNGQFANFTTNNSWDLPVLRPPGTFLAIAAKAISGGGAGRMLQVNPTDAQGKDLYKDYTKMKTASYKGQFPYATWDFTDDKIPLKFTLATWSPLVPHNTNDSSLPGGMVNVLVSNPKNYPISVAVALSWEDLNGRGGSLLPGDQHGVTGRSSHQDVTTSHVTGIQISNDYSLKNREATFTGNYFIGTPIKGATITRKLSWNPRATSIPWWKQFSSKLRLDKIPTSPATITADTANGPNSSTLCVSFNLAPNETRRIPFIISWYFPQIITMDSAKSEPLIETLDYADRFKSSADVASYLANNRVDLRKATDEWFDMVSRSNAPEWLKTHTLNSLFPLKSNSILLGNQRFAMLESVTDMKGMLGAIDLKGVSGDFISSMFPDLEKTELNLYAHAQNTAGLIPRYVGNIHGALSGFDSNLLGTDWVDPTAWWILQVSQYYSQTGDTETLGALKPGIEKGQAVLLKALTDKSYDTLQNVYSVTDNYKSNLAAKLNIVAALKASGQLLGNPSAEINRQISDATTELNSAIAADTFAVNLAADHALSHAGIAPIISSANKTEYLQKVHTALFDTKPVPRMGNEPSNANTQSMPAVLQQSIGAVALTNSLPTIGLDPYIRMFQIAYAAQKNPWKQALRYDVPSAAKAQVRSHRVAMSAWSLWNSLSGVNYDVPTGRLYLNPHSLESSNSEMEIPVFTPTFWAWLKYGNSDSTGTLTITRVMDDYTSSQISSVARNLTPEGTPDNLVNLPEPLLLEEGATIQLNGWPNKPGGTLVALKPTELVTVNEPETTGALSLDNEASTASEAGVTIPADESKATSREIEQGEEMPPTPEQDEPAAPPGATKE